MAESPETADSKRSSMKEQRRPSLNPDAEIIEGSRKLDQGEKRLSVGTMKLRTDCEMWLMKAVAELMGATEETSHELPEDIQEDAQSTFIESVIFDKSELSDADIKGKIGAKFEVGKSKEGWAKFESDFLEMIATLRGSVNKARNDSKSVPEKSVDSCDSKSVPE